MTTPERSRQRKATRGTPRRDEILTVAARIFAEKGVHAATTREIAESASMLSGSLYYYFASKEAMAYEVVSSYLDELMEAYEQVRQSSSPPGEQIAELFRTSLEVSDRRSDEVMILYQDWPALSALDRGLDKIMARVEEIWCGAIHAGQLNGQIRADIDPKIVYRTIMGAIAWVPRWYRPEGPRTITEIAALQADVMLRGMLRGPE